MHFAPALFIRMFHRQRYVVVLLARDAGRWCDEFDRYLRDYFHVVGYTFDHGHLQRRCKLRAGDLARRHRVGQCAACRSADAGASLISLLRVAPTTLP